MYRHVAVSINEPDRAGPVFRLDLRVVGSVEETVSARAGVKCEVVKCEVPVRGINAKRRVICEAGMCEAQRTTGAAGVVIGCEPLKRN